MAQSPSPLSSPPSLPPSHPATYRHLGTAGTDRSVRVQMIIALVAGLVMVAVPLYLWKRPKAEASERDPRRAAFAADGADPLAPSPSSSGAGLAAASPPPSQPSNGVSLSDPKLVKCAKSGAGKTSPEQCDRQPFFEEALVKAIRDNGSCAPTGPGGTINFVLDVDYKGKKVKAFAGKSSTIKRKGRKEVMACVNRALPTPDWTQLPHQHTKYQIAVLTTYPTTGPSNSL